MIKLLLVIGAIVLPIIAVIRAFGNFLPWYSEMKSRAIRGDEPVPIERAGCLHDLISVGLLILGALCVFALLKM